jgi:hypothetical protein
MNVTRVQAWQKQRTCQAKGMSICFWLELFAPLFLSKEKVESTLL